MYQVLVVTRSVQFPSAFLSNIKMLLSSFSLRFENGIFAPKMHPTVFSVQTIVVASFLQSTPKCWLNVYINISFWSVNKMKTDYFTANLRLLAKTVKGCPAANLTKQTDHHALPRQPFVVFKFVQSSWEFWIRCPRQSTEAKKKTEIAPLRYIIW